MAAYEPVSVSPGLPVCASVESSVVGRRSSVVGSGSQTMLEYLERSNLFVVPLDAQRRWYELRPEPLAEIDAWLATYRHLWNRRFDRLDDYLRKLQSQENIDDRQK